MYDLQGKLSRFFDRTNIKLYRENFPFQRKQIHNEVLSIVENALNRKVDVFNSFSYIVSVSVFTVIANDHY